MALALVVKLDLEREPSPETLCLFTVAVAAEVRASNDGSEYLVRVLGLDSPSELVRGVNDLTAQEMELVDDALCDAARQAGV